MFGGLPIGYVYGPDVEHIEGSVALDVDADLTVALDGAVTHKGEFTLGDAWLSSDGKVEDMALAGVVERSRGAGLSVAWSPARGLRTSGRIGHARVRAPDHVAGARASHTTVSMRLDASW